MGSGSGLSPSPYMHDYGQQKMVGRRSIQPSSAILYMVLCLQLAGLIKNISGIWLDVAGALPHSDLLDYVHTAKWG